MTSSENIGIFMEESYKYDNVSFIIKRNSRQESKEERLPSGKFDSNKLVLELTVIAYNILRIIGQESLKKRDDPTRKKVHRRRIRTVIRDLMQFAGHLTEHAGRLVLSIGKSNRWRYTFKRIYDSFALLK